MLKRRYGPENPDITYIAHKYEEHLFDTGEVMLNYAVTGSPDKLALVLIPWAVAVTHKKTVCHRPNIKTVLCAEFQFARLPEK